MALIASAATAVGGYGALAGLVGAGTGLYTATRGGSKQSGTTTETMQKEMDPRMQSLLYGSGQQKLRDGVAPTYDLLGNPTNSAGDYLPADTGLLGQAAGLANKPQSAGLNAFGASMDGYVGGWKGMNGMQGAADRLMAGSQVAPTVSAATANSAWANSAPQMQAAKADAAYVHAPSQNDINLSPAYQKMIYGDAGANPYLTNALQAGVDQTNASFAKNQTDLTNNLMRTVLPSLRSNAVLAGQYGGSRQGIAEGNALSDFTNQLNSANTQLGLANSANTTGAQAQAFNQGQDRSLNALNNLSGQQYGVAQLNAQLAQQSNLANAGFQQGANSQNNSNAQQTGMANAGFQQQSNLANAGFQQQAGLANQSAQLGTNQLNSANTATGLSANQGLLGSAYNYAKANDQYAGQQVQQAGGLLGQFSGTGGSSTATSPYYTNPAGGLLSGATAGLGLYDAFNKATSGGQSSTGMGSMGSLSDLFSKPSSGSVFGSGGFWGN